MKLKHSICIMKIKMWLIAIYRDICYLIYITWLNLTNRLKPLIWHQDSLLNPVMLIHGSGGNNLEWLACSKYRNKWIKNPTYAFSFNHNRLCDDNHYIEHYVKITEKHLLDVYNLHEKPVILIGHSMGGLIAFNLIERHANKIDRIVSISSPIQGAPALDYTIIKKIFNTKRHKQMTSESEYLYKIHNMIKNFNKPILAIGSPHDFHVPEMYAYFDSANVTLNKILGYGHFSIINNDEIWRNICVWLMDSMNNIE